MKKNVDLTTKSKFLNHIHYFRAFAIINIVLIHTWSGPSGYPDHPHSEFIDIAREIAFHGSTIYFIFISGFLFYYLSANFDLVTYYKKKFLHVVSPYIFMTSVIMVIKNMDYLTQGEWTFFYFLKKTARAILDGSAQIQYWYIPFIVLVFVISPLLLKIPKHIFNKMVMLSFILPVLGTRTGTDVTFLQYIYFFPIYLLGIYAAMNYSAFMLFIRRNKNALLFVSIISSVVLILFHGKSYVFGRINIIESIYYIQKISICFLCILFLQKLEDKKIPWLDYFATYSFAIYFTHTLIATYFFRLWYNYQFFSKVPGFIIPLSIFYVITVFFTNYLLCLSIKKSLGKRSRYFIGA